MIVVIGLLALIAAAVLAAASVATNRASTQPLSDNFVISGQHAAGQTRVIYETRQLASVNEAIQEVVQGKARARLVLAP
jgi:hypothetical protein